MKIIEEDFLEGCKVIIEFKVKENSSISLYP